MTPVVTKYRIEEEGSVVKIIWQQVDFEEAVAVLSTPQNQEKLRQNLKDGGVDTPVADYFQNIVKNLDDLKNVWGSHQYDFENGYYEYTQHVAFNNWFVRSLVDYFGVPRIKGSALKIAYLTIDEHERAAPAGTKGAPVKARNGSILRPDI